MYRSSHQKGTTLPQYHPETIKKKYFEKKFLFKKNSKWNLPDIQDLFQDNTLAIDVAKHSKLQDVKKCLNTVKNKLNDYSLEIWSKHTHKRDPSGSIGWFLNKDIGAEFVTKAWCKFFECLNNYPIVQMDENHQFNSFHLCEAPGAFVASLNHYIKLNFDKFKVRQLT